MILLICGVVLLALLVTNWLISAHVAENITEQMGRTVMYVARMVAYSPVVKEGLSGDRNEKDIQDYANSIRNLTQSAIVVVFDMQGMRKSHPDESKLGFHVVGGDEERALRGEEYLSYATGTVGPQLRAFTPVYTEGRQVGAVVVGIHIGDVKQAVAESRTRIFITIFLGSLIGVAGAVLLARSVKKTMFGLEPAGIAKLLEERNAMLQSVKEGILAVDLTGRITMVNEVAIGMLAAGGVTGNPLGREIDGYVPNTGLTRVLRTGLPELNKEQDLNGIDIITNRVPILVNGQIVGAIATFRDKTEINQLAEELTGVRSYVEALRSQAHEFMNKLHVILGLVRLESYDQLAGYIKSLADAQEAEVSLVGKRIKDPVLAGLVLSKLSKSREMGVSMTVTEETSMFFHPSAFLTHELVTIIGNLIDNALEAVQPVPDKQVSLSIYEIGRQLVIRIWDKGPGVPPNVRGHILEKGFSTKAANRGFGLYLVDSSIKRLNGSLEFSTSSQGTEVIVKIPVETEGESFD